MEWVIRIWRHGRRHLIESSSEAVIESIVMNRAKAVTYVVVDCPKDRNIDWKWYTLGPSLNTRLEASLFNNWFFHRMGLSAVRKSCRDRIMNLARNNWIAEKTSALGSTNRFQKRLNWRKKRLQTSDPWKMVKSKCEHFSNTTQTGRFNTIRIAPYMTIRIWTFRSPFLPSWLLPLSLPQLLSRAPEI